MLKNCEVVFGVESGMPNWEYEAICALSELNAIQERRVRTKRCLSILVVKYHESMKWPLQIAVVQSPNEIGAYIPILNSKFHMRNIYVYVLIMLVLICLCASDHQGPTISCMIKMRAPHLQPLQSVLF